MTKYLLTGLTGLVIALTPFALHAEEVSVEEHAVEEAHDAATTTAQEECAAVAEQSKTTDEATGESDYEEIVEKCLEKGFSEDQADETADDMEDHHEEATDEHADH